MDLISNTTGYKTYKLYTKVVYFSTLNKQC